MNKCQNKDFFEVLAAIQLPNLEKFMQFGKQIIGKNPIYLGPNDSKSKPSRESSVLSKFNGGKLFFL